MLRSLALPVAVAAVLTLSACASVDDASSTAPARPGASATQTGTSPAPDASATAPSETEPSDAEPTASATESGSGQPEDSSATDAAAQGDPGVPGLPQLSGASIDDVLRLGAVATWIEQPVLIALSLPATSDCWPFAAEPVVESPTLIVVHVELPQPCGAPNAARTYAIPVPDGVDTSADLHLAVVGLEHEFTLTLPSA
ncbi:MAG: hypothetical protein ACQEWM_00890 [Actinomycetota bacterium]